MCVNPIQLSFSVFISSPASGIYLEHLGQPSYNWTIKPQLSQHPIMGKKCNIHVWNKHFFSSTLKVMKMQKLNLYMDLRNKNQQYIITKISEIFPGLEHMLNYTDIIWHVCNFFINWNNQNMKNFVITIACSFWWSFLKSYLCFYSLIWSNN